MRKLWLVVAMASWVRAVTPVPAGDLIHHPANYFDLDHRQLTFRPGRRLVVKPVAKLLPRGEAFKPGPLRLPFRFPFGGRMWTELWVNLNGNLTFDGPESTVYPYRATWPDGTMRTRAAMADLAAITGTQHMIAPFWGLNDLEGTRITLRSSSKELVVTWDAVRHKDINEGYTPLGRNVFQARLKPDGSVDFLYGGISEKDGIAGLFGGLAQRRKVLDRAASVELDEAGSVLHFAMTPATPVPESSGYRIVVAAGGTGAALVHTDRGTRCIGLLLDSERAWPTDCAVEGATTRSGDRIHFYLPKLALKTPGDFEWTATGPLRKVRLAHPMRHGADLSAWREPLDGSLYEVFHYPSVPKSRHNAFRELYRRVPANAELGIIFTDFRIDDLHNHGASNHLEEHGQLPAKGHFGSQFMRSAAGPIYLGPRFEETIRAPARTYRNHAFGVAWMAHEMLHLWGVRVRWKEPNPEALLDTDCRCHWNPYLETSVIAPVWSLFADEPYPEASIMGGMMVVKKADGSEEGLDSGGAASGLCPLDLYLMGLMKPEEVPATRMVSGKNWVPVRVQDIVAVNGPLKVPTQRAYRLGIYLVHEDGREPYPEKLTMARGLERMLIRYFSVATQERMTVRAE